MWIGLIPTLRNNSCIASALNSDPLSERAYSGEPCLSRSKYSASKNVFCAHPRRDDHCQCLTVEIIQHSEHLVAPIIAELVVSEVNRPDVVWMCGPEPDNRTVLVIEPFALLTAPQGLWICRGLIPPFDSIYCSSPRVEKPRRFRTKSGLNERLGRD